MKKVHDHIQFTEDDHKYVNTDTGEQYISVTTLIHKFVPPFDEDFWSNYKAAERILKPSIFRKINREIKDMEERLNAYREYIIPEKLKAVQKEILGEWKVKEENSHIKGNKFHLAREKEVIESEYFGYDGTMEDLVGRIFKTHADFDLKRKGCHVYAEYLVFDDEYCIAGQIDRLYVVDNKVYILDFKTNNTLDKESYFNTRTGKYDSLLPPLSHLMDCNWIHYNLQLSLYAYLLERKGFEVKELEILHADIDNETHEVRSTTYEPCEYLKEEIETILNYRKNQL